jgi:hypothetical protein
MSDNLSGDPFHEGSSKPQQSLQGGMEMPHTQTPMTSEAQTNPRSAAGDNVGQSWNSTSLAPSAGSTGSNDKNKAH